LSTPLVGGMRHKNDDACNGGEEAYDGKGIIHKFNGLEWQVVFERSEENSRIESIWGLSPDSIYAVGGVHEESINISQSGISQFDGMSWVTISSEEINWEHTRAEETFYQQKIHAFGPDRFYLLECYHVLVGNGCNLVSCHGTSCDVLKSAVTLSFWGTSWNSLFMMDGNIGQGSYFDGLEWTQLVSEDKFTLSGNSANNTTEMWGRAPDDIYAIGVKGRIVHYDGKSWKQIKTNISGDLKGVWGTDEAIYVVGDDDAALQREERFPAIWRIDQEAQIRVY
jgi:hypothetical protein